MCTNDSPSVIFRTGVVGERLVSLSLPPAEAPPVPKRSVCESAPLHVTSPAGRKVTNLSGCGREPPKMSADLTLFRILLGNNCTSSQGTGGDGDGGGDGGGGDAGGGAGGGAGGEAGGSGARMVESVVVG